MNLSIKEESARPMLDIIGKRSAQQHPSSH